MSSGVAVPDSGHVVNSLGGKAGLSFCEKSVCGWHFDHVALSAFVSSDTLCHSSQFHPLSHPQKKNERCLRWPQPVSSCACLTTAVSFPNREMGQGLLEGRGSGLNLLAARLPLPAFWSPLHKLNSAICLMRAARYCRGLREELPR